MNNVIEFKKDCIMKTMISEITDISLTHDYKILDDLIEGYFNVSGEYKVTKASLTKEEFMYTIPFTIALSSLIDRSSINLTIKDFNYEIEKDILHLKMDLNMEYIETTLEEKPTLTEEEISIEEILKEEEPEIELENPKEIIEESNIEQEEINLIEKEEAKESMKSIVNTMEEDTYYKYKIYIMRSEDTLESIAIKYNVTLDNLREYNDLENINIGDKIIIPIINNEN